MGQETCELCGYVSLLGAVEKHHIIPNEITEEAGIPKLQTIKMCYNCRKELDTWYSAKVAKMVYDTKIPKFRYKTPGEMVEEYQFLFNGFVDYKKRQNKKN